VTEPAKAFGQAIREARASREMSQEQLAFDCDFDRTYISLVERGVRSPTIRSLLRLAEVLEVPPSSLVARMEAILSTSKPKIKS
jgi:transcriptional regulator with XRE-family HTH domain